MEETIVEDTYYLCAYECSKQSVQNCMWRWRKERKQTLPRKQVHFHQIKISFFFCFLPYVWRCLSLANLYISTMSLIFPPFHLTTPYLKTNMERKHCRPCNFSRPRRKLLPWPKWKSKGSTRTIYFFCSWLFYGKLERTHERERRNREKILYPGACIWKVQHGY